MTPFGAHTRKKKKETVAFSESSETNTFLDTMGLRRILASFGHQSPICSPAVHIDCRSTYFSHYTVLPTSGCQLAYMVFRTAMTPK